MTVGMSPWATLGTQLRSRSYPTPNFLGPSLGAATPELSSSMPLSALPYSRAAVDLGARPDQVPWCKPLLRGSGRVLRELGLGPISRTA